MDISKIFIPVNVRTYRDNLKTQSWPRFLCCRPMVGDMIRSNAGKEAKITNILHANDEDGPFLEITVGL